MSNKNLHVEDLVESAMKFLQDQSITIINISCAEAQLKLMETVASYNYGDEG